MNLELCIILQFRQYLYDAKTFFVTFIDKNIKKIFLIRFRFY